MRHVIKILSFSKNYYCILLNTVVVLYFIKYSSSFLKNSLQNKKVNLKSSRFWQKYEYQTSKHETVQKTSDTP